VACTGVVHCRIPGGSGRTSALRGERRLDLRTAFPAPIGSVPYWKELKVVLCLSVRLNRKTRSLIGGAPASQEMFWLESMNVISEEQADEPAGEDQLPSPQEPTTAEVRWYRLRGRTYFSA
jgi:hypothetical protein